jgi:stearoyl-CoA desaturase (Delta-9 desaturase)
LHEEHEQMPDSDAGQRTGPATLLDYLLFNPRLFALVGAPIAVIVVSLYGLPTNARVGFYVMTFATGFGITLGYHRLFSHRSFTTIPSVERVLMVLGCMAGQHSPFLWVATHRVHHRHSD